MRALIDILKWVVTALMSGKFEAPHGEREGHLGALPAGRLDLDRARVRARRGALRDLEVDEDRLVLLLRHVERLPDRRARVGIDEGDERVGDPASPVGELAGTGVLPKLATTPFMSTK